MLPEVPTGQCWSAVVAAVSHREFTELPADYWRQLLEPAGVLLDLKGIVPRELGALRL